MTNVWGLSKFSSWSSADSLSRVISSQWRSKVWCLSLSPNTNTSRQTPQITKFTAIWKKFITGSSSKHNIICCGFVSTIQGSYESGWDAKFYHGHPLHPAHPHWIALLTVSTLCGEDQCLIVWMAGLAGQNSGEPGLLHFTNLHKPLFL